MQQVKIFIQINIGSEEQKSGINKDQTNHLLNFCKESNLDVIGLMCIPPANEEPDKYFKELNVLSKKFRLPEISMGMSSDFLKAVENSATYLRIGSRIFGKRD